MINRMIGKTTTFLLLGLVALVLKAAALPTLAEGLLVHQFDRMGLSQVEFTVGRLGRRCVELENLHWAGDWPLRAKRVDIRYDRLVLTGRQPCEVQVEGGELSIRLPGQSRPTGVQFEGRLTRVGEGSANFQVGLHHRSNFLEVTGSLRRTPDGTVLRTDEVTLDAQDLAGLWGDAGQEAPPLVQGKLTAVVEAQLRRPRPEIRLALKAACLQMGQIQVRELAGAVGLVGHIAGPSVEFSLLPESQLEFGQATVGRAWTLQGARVACRGDRAPSVVRASRSTEGVELLFDLGVTCSDHSQNVPGGVCSSATGFGVRGDLSLQGNCRIKQGWVTPDFRLTAHDATIMVPRHSTELCGVEGSLAITDSFAVRTPVDECLSVRQLRLGSFRLQQGSMRLRLARDPAAILVEDTQWQWWGGQLYGQGLHIDPNAGVITGTVCLDGLRLDKFLPLVFGPEATAEGILQGTLTFGGSPGSRPALQLTGGSLVAASDGGCWKIPAPAVKAALASVGAKDVSPILPSPECPGKGAGPTELANGLLDFEYDILRVDFAGEPQGFSAHVTTSGQTRTTRVPIEFKQIDLAIRGFDSRLLDRLAW